MLEWAEKKIELIQDGDQIKRETDIYNQHCPGPITIIERIVQDRRPISNIMYSGKWYRLGDEKRMMLLPVNQNLDPWIILKKVKVQVAEDCR